jgi:mercuric ion transport protein
MIKVELIYEQSCPNIVAAREQLILAFNQANLTPQWQEWEMNHPETPDYARQYGSPTILVNGQDVSGESLTDTSVCCRIYQDSDVANRGVPAVSKIVAALGSATTQSGEKKSTSNRYGLNFAMVPGIGVALLPKLACPACWPAYAGLLSSMGIGFIDYTPYLMPFTSAFILIALIALAYRAPNRRGYGPLALGALASGFILFGKFYFDSDRAMFIGVAILVLASLWNTWPKKMKGSGSCPACV